MTGNNAPPNRLWILWLIGLFVLALAGLPARAASSTVVISEVLYDPSGTEPDGEWIEIYNLSSSTIDLSNYKIGDEETSGGGEGMRQFPSGASIAPGQVVVVANRASAFSSVYGFNPDYEINDSDGNVPDMIHYANWAGGSMQLANSSDEVLLLDGIDNIVDAVSWGSSTFAFDPAAPDVTQDHSLERNPADADSDSAGDWIDQSAPDPGNVVTDGGGSDPTATATPGNTPTPTATVAPGCGKSDSYLAVWEVQGNGHSSPYDGQNVNNVRGIVTADFQNSTGGPYEPWGFYIQAYESDCDDTTSDGLFVYTSSTAKNIEVGDLVEIDGGSVVEYQGPSSFIWERTLTELECRGGCQVSTLQSGYGLPPVEEYDPPSDNASALDYNEAREGMLVQVTTDGTVISPSDPFNEFAILRGADLDRLHRDDGATGHIVAVDGDGVAAANCGQDGFGYIKTFDTVSYDPANGAAVYGPLTYNFNMYKVQQDDDTYCISANPGDDSSYDPADNPAPAADANVLTVASLNALNFFDTDDDPEKSDPVLSQAEYDLKAAKQAAAICNSSGLNQPLIIGLQEVENDVVLQRLSDEVDALCGVTYDYHALAGPDDRSIETAFLTRADRVTALAVNDRQGCSATNWGIDYENSDHPPDVNCSGSTPYYLFNRTPMHLEAQITLGGSTRTVHVINNHFKSKLSSASCSEPDCTDRRVEQAQHVDNLVDNLLAADPNAYVIVMGDLNDYYHSDPLDVLDDTNGVLTNVWGDLAGPPSSGQGTIQRYSYVYNGVAQTLDHMLVSDSLNALVRTVSPRHLNADWPGSHETDTSMYRSSDHDFLLVGYDFSGGSEPTPTPTPENTPTPTPTPENTPAPTATPENTPTPTATPQDTPTLTPTATPGSSSTMHVADLDGTSSNEGSTWTAYVTVSIFDGSGNPVSNATVEGNWGNGASGSASCTTGSAGVCTVSESGIAKRNGSVTFIVSNVSHDTLAYDAGANTDPDGDSDGTTITVSKP